MELGDFLHGDLQIEGDRLERKLARLELREVQDVVDDPH